MNEENSNPDSANSQSRHGFAAAIEHMSARKIDALLWLTRTATIVFSFLAVIPIFGFNPYVSYQRALLSNAATSALRLHQRLPRVQFTREFGTLLMLEDSCHYLFYSVLFVFSYPITFALFPVFLFAILHSASYSIVILNKLGRYDTGEIKFLVYIISNHQRNILRLVALAEVGLMPLTVLLVFSGKGNLLAPLAYYRFLTFRYISRRNPYTRTVFHEMRVILENFANSPGRSPVIKNVCTTIINITSRLAPPVMTQNQQ